MSTPATSNVGHVVLTRDTGIALHSQISDGIRQRIASGEWPSNYRLRPEPELAVEMGVSRGTLRRALATLIEEGLLRQVQGRGTFVTSTLLEPAIAQKLSTLAEDFASQGIEVSTTVRSSELVGVPQPVARLLDARVGQDVLRLERLRSTADGPVALMINYVRSDVTPGIEMVDFEGSSLFATLEGRYRLKIHSGRRTFAAVAADPAVADALGVAPGSPVLYLEQVTYLSDGRPIEYSDVWIKSDMLKVTSLLARR